MKFVLRRKHFLTDVAVVTINSERVSFLKPLDVPKRYGCEKGNIEGRERERR